MKLWLVELHQHWPEAELDNAIGIAPSRGLAQLIGKYFFGYSNSQAAENDVGKIWIVSATAYGMLVRRTGNGSVIEGTYRVIEG